MKYPRLETNQPCTIGQVGGSVEGFFWPKVFWDFVTQSLNSAVKPIPVLQIINLVLGITALAWEWPLKPLAGSLPHRSIVARLLIYPLSALTCALMYQTGDVAVYYLIGIAIYFWAYSEGEVRLSRSLKVQSSKDRC
jgi:thymine-DNA glycosylase